MVVCMELQEYLNNSIILSRHDIDVFKKYIYEKYASEDNLKKALVLADAINKVMNRHLAEIPDMHKDELRKAIYLDFINSNYTEISKLNLFNKIISDDFFEKIGENIIIDWLEKTSEKNFKITEIIKLINISKPKNQVFPEEFKIPEFMIIKNENSKDLSKVGVNTKNNFRFMPFAASLILFAVIFGKSIDTDFENSIKYANSPVGVYEIKAPTIINSEDMKKIEHEIMREKFAPENYRSSYKRNSINFSDFKYTYFDHEKLRLYLSEKNSILAEEPYFSTIIEVSKLNSYDPRLLFALTGQEQSFVPIKNSMASEIANNPYNVFYSWKHYNTDIADSTEIAIKTINNMLKKMPEGANPFKWMNKTYAEDPNWWRGVQSIYKELIEVTT